MTPYTYYLFGKTILWILWLTSTAVTLKLIFQAIVSIHKKALRKYTLYIAAFDSIYLPYFMMKILIGGVEYRMKVIAAYEYLNERNKLSTHLRVVFKILFWYINLLTPLPK